MLKGNNNPKVGISTIVSLDVLAVLQGCE
jgi:hypothetical protein